MTKLASSGISIVGQCPGSSGSSPASWRRGSASVGRWTVPGGWGERSGGHPRSWSPWWRASRSPGRWRSGCRGRTLPEKNTIVHHCSLMSLSPASYSFDSVIDTLARQKNFTKPGFEPEKRKSLAVVKQECKACEREQPPGETHRDSSQCQQFSGFRSTLTIIVLS